MQRLPVILIVKVAQMVMEGIKMDYKLSAVYENYFLVRMRIQYLLGC